MLIIQEKIKYLFTGYFALVMATGALSIASSFLGFSLVSHLLVYCNLFFYFILSLFIIIRCIYYFDLVKKDLMNHLKGPGFFTLVAGTNVLGSQLIVIKEWYIFDFTLWIIAILLWIVIMYSFFTAVTISKNKPSLEEGINGAWLIASVATQSLSVLGILLLPLYDNELLINIVYFFALSMYLLGCMLYLSIITLIFYRLTFLHLRYASLTPPYWINMGAVAITALAGSTLILSAEESEFMGQFLAFIKGFTLFFWVAGSWWIPLLFILMCWRYIIHRFPINYDQQMWGMVFPLAMYTTATYQLSKAISVPFLENISEFFIYPSYGLWFIGIIFLVCHLYKDFVLQK